MSTALFDPIKTQSTITDSVAVAFSGGKESVVVLDLCCRYFKRVYPFFMYICPNLSFEERTLRWYERKYGVEIMRIPHNMMSVWMHYGYFRDFDPYFPVVSSNDIYNYIRIVSGCEWIAAGERAADSMWRLARLHKCGSVDLVGRRFFPLLEWKKKDVFNYIKHHRLYLGKDSQALGFSFRSLHGEELIKIRDLFPDDYAKIERLYPLCGAAVKREEMRIDGEKQVSEL